MVKLSVHDASTLNRPSRPAGPEDPVALKLTILTHPRAVRVGDSHILSPFTPGRRVAISRTSPEWIAPEKTLGAPLADVFVSRRPIHLIALEGGRLRLVAEDGGTPVSVNNRPCVTAEFDAADLRAGVVIELCDRIGLLLHAAEIPRDTGAPSMGMVGQSAALWATRRAIASILDLEVPVLIRGETGTGKELVAQAIHKNGSRRTGPFVSVNLGAIPKELAAAELFGAVKGAFTGAMRDREGLFAAARGGTLFLDEVGEAPPEVQVMLLRVLETAEMTPIGGHMPTRTDVRLIAATDANLEMQIKDGRFRAPLLHRLAGYTIRLPPLRERIEDIGPLFIHFARQELSATRETHRLDPEDPRADPWMPSSLMTSLLRHSWPGNVRELRNVTRQLVIGNRGQPVLRLDAHLSAELSASSRRAESPLELRQVEAREIDDGRAVPRPSRPVDAPVPRRKAADVTEGEVLEALREHRWDLKTAADALGIARSSIYDLVDRLPSIRTAGKLSVAEIEAAHRTSGGDIDAMVESLQVSRKALSRRLKEMGLAVKSR